MENQKINVLIDETEQEDDAMINELEDELLSQDWD
jgi:hypothetical protein